MSTSPALDRSIEKFDFDNATWKATGETVKLTNGIGTTGSGSAAMHYGTRPDGSWLPDTSIRAFGDLNVDGYEDAVVTLNWAAGNGVGSQPYVWLGGASGPTQLTSTTIPGGGQCGDVLENITIKNSAVITTGKLLEWPCSAPRTTPFTRIFVVNGTTISQISGPTSN